MILKQVAQNASREYLFQYTISTIESFQSDALYSYQPPFNLVAYIILLPMSFILSPRSLHTVNVFLIKVTVRQDPLWDYVILTLQPAYVIDVPYSRSHRDLRALFRARAANARIRQGLLQVSPTQHQVASTRRRSRRLPLFYTL